MIKQYFKQSLVLLQQNKLLSVIAIIGTALAIAMIMCIVLIYQARTANYEPEINRDRTLSIEMTIAQKIDDKGWNMGNQLSLHTIKRRALQHDVFGGYSRRNPGSEVCGQLYG